LPFEEGIAAAVAGGESQPITEGKHRSNPGQAVAGIRGRGMLLSRGERLYYRIPGNYSNARGTMAFWIKFLEAKPDQNHRIFYELGKYKPGSQILRLFTISDKSLYYNFADERGRWSGTPFSIPDMLGEWHQVVLTWDKDIGDRIYVDGRFRQHRGGYTRTIVHNFQRGTKDHEIMAIGPDGGNDVKYALDEFELYGRMLSEEEIAAKYSDLFPLNMRVSPLVSRLGKPSQTVLSLVNRSSRSVKGDVVLRIGDEDGNVIKEAGGPGITIDPGKSAEVPVDYVAPAAGRYRLDCVFSADTDLRRTFFIYALPEVKGALAKQDDVQYELRLLKEFDCTKDYGPEEFCDDGTSTVVDSPMGRYRETSDRKLSRFAYRFHIEDVDAPHLAVVEYPDDKDRMIEVMIDTKTNRGAPVSECGIVTGDDFPNSNRFSEFRILFFPNEKECAIQFANWHRKGHKQGDPVPPAACRRIRIYRALNGMPAVKLHNLPPLANQRLVGFEEENSTISRNLSGDLRGHGADFDSMYKTLSRYAEYMDHIGQNVFVHDLIHYAGSMYPSEVTERDLNHTSLYGDYWVDMALDIFRQRDMKFIASIVFWENPELAKTALLGPDAEGVIRGEDTVRQVAWNGELGPMGYGHHVHYDILHPLVEKQILAMVDDILRQYGGHPAFGGLSFWFWAFHSLWFENLKWGYSDTDVGLFEKETGINVPGRAPDPRRFAKRFSFLTRKDPAMREKWIAWRCKKVHELWMKIYGLVQASNPDHKLTIETWALNPGTRGENRRGDHWKPGDLKSVYNFHRNGGLDLDLFRDVPNFYIGKVYYHNHRPVDARWYDRDFEFAPANVVPFRNRGANASWLEQDRWENDNSKHSQKMPGYWWKEVSSNKSAPLMPHADFYLEHYAEVLASFDARLITDGGMGVTTLGHEKEVRDFYRAFRTIPAETFDLFKNVDDPLCVRHRMRDDGLYFYMVNREFYPVAATVSFDTDRPFDLLDLAADKKRKVKRTTAVTVGPFRVVSFRAPTGVSLENVTVAIPHERLAWLGQRTAEVHAMIGRLEEEKIELTGKPARETQRVTAEIDRALEEGRYARLRKLLDSYQVRRVRMLLRDERLRSFLSVPQSYRDKFLDPLTLTVKKVAQVPPIGSKLWTEHFATDMFSEVMVIEGKFAPRPTEDGTRVSILYDPGNIGLLFRCYDKEAAEVIAKKVERDGSVIARDDDSVEVFLSHDEGYVPYYHFMANFGCSFKDRKAPEQSKWYNPEWTIETKKLPDSWLARIVIPFKELEKTPAPGDTWGLNLCRNQRGVNSAFRCDPKKGFHCPDYFARLTFE